MSQGQLHIFAQDSWHCDAHIVGDVQSLMDLRDAINRTLLSRKSRSMGAFVNDGEGYNVMVTLLEDVEKFDKLATPYTAEYARNGAGLGRVNAILPEHLIPGEEYKNLVDEPWKDPAPNYYDTPI